MTDNTHISSKNASSEYDTSYSNIRRLIGKIKQEGREEELLEKNERGEVFILKSYLDDYFKDKKSASTERDEVIELLKDKIAYLEKQLEESKDMVKSEKEEKMVILRSLQMEQLKTLPDDQKGEVIRALSSDG